MSFCCVDLLPPQDRTPSGPGDVAHLAAAGGTSYIHNPFGGLSTSTTGAATTWALTDALGSTRALTDTTGAVAGTTGYDAFGAVTAKKGDQSLFGFAGEQRDSGGLVNLRSRSCDTSTGQFLQADTLLRSRPATVGFNTYAYAGNNPTTWTDPTGHAAATEEGGLLGGLSVPEDLAGRALGKCAQGALADVATGLGVAAVTGGASIGSSAVDAVTGCVTSGRDKLDEAERIARPHLPGGYPSFSAAKQAMGSPGPGNVFDHVVEQSQAKATRSGFAIEDINNPFNMNPVAARVNQIKANYYSSKPRFTGGKRVRDWLSVDRSNSSTSSELTC
jgi:RHS repeat-associated protein